MKYSVLKFSMIVSTLVCSLTAHASSDELYSEIWRGNGGSVEISVASALCEFSGAKETKVTIEKVVNKTEEITTIDIKSEYKVNVSGVSLSVQCLTRKILVCDNSHSKCDDREQKVMRSFSTIQEFKLTSNDYSQRVYYRVKRTPNYNGGDDAMFETIKDIEMDGKPACDLTCKLFLLKKVGVTVRDISLFYGNGPILNVDLKVSKISNFKEDASLYKQFLKQTK